MDAILSSFNEKDLLPFSPYKYPVSSGTLTPECFFGCFENNFEYIRLQPVLRPTDIRGEYSIIHSALFNQLQIFCNWSTKKIVDSLKQFTRQIVEDNVELSLKKETWHAESIDCRGTGFEVLSNDIEIAQINILNSMGGIQLNAPKKLLSIGIDRLFLLRDVCSKKENIDNKLSNIFFSKYNLMKLNTFISNSEVGSEMIVSQIEDQFNKIEMYHQKELTVFDYLSYVLLIVDIAYSKGIISNLLRRNFILRTKKTYRKLANNYSTSHLFNHLIESALFSPKNNDEVEWKDNYDDSYIDNFINTGLIKKCHLHSIVNYFFTKDDSSQKRKSSMDNIVLTGHQFQRIDHFVENIKTRFNKFENYYEAKELKYLLNYDLHIDIDHALSIAKNTISINGIITNKINRIKKYLDWFGSVSSNKSAILSKLSKNPEILFIDYALVTSKFYPFLFGAVGKFYINSQKKYSTIAKLIKLIHIYDKNHSQYNNLQIEDSFIVSSVLLDDCADILLVHNGKKKSDPYGFKRKVNIIRHMIKNNTELKKILTNFIDNLVSCIIKEDNTKNFEKILSLKYTIVK